MKKTLLSLPLIMIIILFIGAKKKNQTATPGTFDHDASVCGSGLFSKIQAAANGKFIPLVPGTGHHHYAVRTASDSAQIYFDQGLSFYYGYHMAEAMASFKEAARLDPNCLMAWWGQALALGPFFNSYTYKMSGEVPNVLQSLQRANTGADARENDLALAMLKRYSADTSNSDRKRLDLAYANAMRQLADKYAADNDIKLLYVDAVMLCHKWDFWRTDRTAKPWTTELVSICQAVLKAEPDNAAAIHYYIHLTEASGNPEQALPYAEKLGQLNPGVAHMVHMASHSYQRNGLFTTGVTSNDQAVEVFEKEDAITGLHLNRNQVVHFAAVQSYCAMNAGMFQKGMPLYLRAKDRITALKPPFKNDPYAQFVYLTPEIAMVRFGKWEAILAEPRPDKQWKYALILDDFAKGLAQVHQNNLAEANVLLSDLKASLADSMLHVRRMPYNKPSQSGEIARDILAGEILYVAGKTTDAIASLNKAVQEEDQLVYREPQEWFIPARQYLGYYLLKMDRPVEAEQVYRQDLAANPGNGWSLAGMYNALQARHETAGAADFKTKYTRAFSAADVKPLQSVY